MKPTIWTCYAPFLIIHEHSFKLVRYQIWETCIGVGCLIFRADRFIFDVRTYANFTDDVPRKQRGLNQNNQ